MELPRQELWSFMRESGVYMIPYTLISYMSRNTVVTDKQKKNKGIVWLLTTKLNEERPAKQLQQRPGKASEKRKRVPEVRKSLPSSQQNTGE